MCVRLIRCALVRFRGIKEEEFVVRRFASILAFVCLASALAVSTARAQGLTGQLSGTVADTGGGVMPGVTVVIKNAGTNQTRETVTGTDGAFVFPDLLAGTYDI